MRPTRRLRSGPGLSIEPSPLMTAHRYAGACPDLLQPDARDPACSACFPGGTGVECATCRAPIGVPCCLTRGPFAGVGTAMRPHDARRRALRAREDATADV